MRPGAVLVGSLIVLAACADGSTVVSIPEPTGTIVGRVVTSGGAPISDVTVNITPFAPGVRSDATGHFAFEELMLGTEYRVNALKVGCTSSAVDVPVTKQQPVISIEFTLLCFG